MLSHPVENAEFGSGGSSEQGHRLHARPLEAIVGGAAAPVLLPDAVQRPRHRRLRNAGLGIEKAEVDTRKPNHGCHQRSTGVDAPRGENVEYECTLKKIGS